MEKSLFIHIKCTSQNLLSVGWNGISPDIYQVVKNIPGGRYDSQETRWILPGDAQTAQTLLQGLWETNLFSLQKASPALFSHTTDTHPNKKGARANAQAMGFEDKIHYEICSVEDAKCPEDGGFIITNPPYGERLETKEQARILMAHLKDWQVRFPGYRLGVISPLEDVPQIIGKDPFMKRPLHNGALEVNYWQFT